MDLLPPAAKFGTNPAAVLDLFAAMVGRQSEQQPKPTVAALT